MALNLLPDLSDLPPPTLPAPASPTEFADLAAGDMDAVDHGLSSVDALFPGPASSLDALLALNDALGADIRTGAALLDTLIAEQDADTLIDEIAQAAAAAGELDGALADSNLLP